MDNIGNKFTGFNSHSNTNQTEEIEIKNDEVSKVRNFVNTLTYEDAKNMLTNKLLQLLPSERAAIIASMQPNNQSTSPRSVSPQIVINKGRSSSFSSEQRVRQVFKADGSETINEVINGSKNSGCFFGLPSFASSIKDCSKSQLTEKSTSKKITTVSNAVSTPVSTGVRNKVQNKKENSAFFQAVCNGKQGTDSSKPLSNKSKTLLTSSKKAFEQYNQYADLETPYHETNHSDSDSSEMFEMDDLY